MAVRCSGVRGAEGATARMFFLDEFGKPLQAEQNTRVLLHWTGSFPWRVDQVRVSVPPGATRAMLQIDKIDSLGTIRIDDVRVTASPEAAGRHVDPVPRRRRHRATWFPVAASPRIAAGSALDVSFLVPAPAGRGGFVTVKEGHLYSSKDGRARFLGVSLLAAVGVPRARAGRCPGRSTGPIRHQPRPAGRSRHAVGTGAQPDRRHPGRHQVARHRGPGPARPPDRRLEGPRDLRRAGAPGLPPLPLRRRGRIARTAPARWRAGGRAGSDHRQAGPGYGPRPARATSTPRPGWPCATTPPWPG